MPEVLADLSGPLGEKVRRELPNSDLACRIWSSVRDFRDIHGVSEETMANVVPESWRNRAFRTNELRASWQSDVEMSSHDGETISSHKAQHKLGQQVNGTNGYVASLDQFSEEAGPSGSNDVFGRIEIRDLSQAHSSATEPIGTSRCRLSEDEACGPGTNHTGLGVRVYKTVLPGNGRTPSGEVPLLRSDGCQHALRAHMPPSRRVGKPASTAYTRCPAPLSGCHPP